MKRECWGIAIILLVLLSCKTTKNKEYIELVGQAQGTTFYIAYFDSNSRDYTTELQTILENFDQEVSTYKPRSIINQFNDNSLDTIWKSDHTYLYHSFALSAEVKSYTQGYFDAGIYPIIQLGNSSNNVLSAGNRLVDSVMKIPRDFYLTEKYVTKLDKRSQFNFNAIAQGYSVDVLAHFFESKGVVNYMVEIGGELRVKGKNKFNKYWTVSLEAPNSTAENREIQEIVAVNNLSVVTSGSYRKFKEIEGKKYSHAINPFTGQGVTHSLLSVTVIQKDAAIADGLATAFLVMGKEKTIQFLESNNFYDVSLLFIESDEEGNYKSSYFGGFEELIVE